MYYTDENAEHMIACDLCKADIQLADPDGNDKLPDGVITLGAPAGGTYHICESCRYAGAGKHLAEHQYANGHIGIEISGGLRSVFRSVSQEHARVSECGYRLTLTAPDFNPEEQVEIVKRELIELYHAMSLMESTLGNVINELERVGWPIEKAYMLPATMAHRKKHWPNKAKSTP
jgi:hypothetical protein